MSSQWDELVGRKLSEVREHLESLSVPYDVHHTRGRKDQELLLEEYVIRAVGTKDHVELICSAFKTTLE